MPPTLREVQEALGFRAIETAREHLNRLAAEGRLVRREGKARGYALPPEASRGGRSDWVPVLGRVQAGGLNAAIEEIEGYVPVRRTYSGDLFGLRVQGESMVGAGILPGDVVVVRSQPTAASGEIVVALVDDEATVKRLRLARGRIELHPENPEFAVITPPPDRCRLLGKVVEVHRYLESEGETR